MSPASTLLGAESGTVQHRWTEDDVMLHALAVGAGHDDPARELELTTENSAGIALVALPTFANTLTRCAKIDLSSLDVSGLVHAEQAFELHGPLPLAGVADVSARVTEVWDKGSGALLTIEATAVAAGGGTPLATSWMSLFVRGAGGFGGERGPSSTWETPTGPPDTVVALRTRPDQALLYRLTGDHNPLHSDPAHAARAGFDRPILHGMCTYGVLGRSLFQRFCDSRPERFRSMRARFARPVYPGDELELSAWSDCRTVRFTASHSGQTVVDRGRLDLHP